MDSVRRPTPMDRHNSADANAARLNLLDQRIEDLQNRVIKDVDHVQTLLNEIIDDVEDLKHFVEGEREDRKRKADDGARRAQVLSHRLNVLMQFGAGVFVLALGTFSQAIHGDGQKYVLLAALAFVCVMVVIIVLALIQAGRA